MAVGLPVGLRTRLQLFVAGHAAFVGYELELKPNERSDLGTLELHGKTVAGVVSDPAGEPIAAARVLLSWDENFLDPTGRVLLTDVKGRFEAPYLPGGLVELRVRVLARGFLPVERSWWADFDSELALTLQPEPR